MFLVQNFYQRKENSLNLGRSKFLYKNKSVARGWAHRQGRRHGGTANKGYFCKSSETDEKIFGVWGEGDVTNHT